MRIGGLPVLCTLSQTFKINSKWSDGFAAAFRLC